MINTIFESLNTNKHTFFYSDLGLNLKPLNATLIYSSDEQSTPILHISTEEIYSDFGMLTLS